MDLEYCTIKGCLFPHSTRGRVVPYKTVKALISEPSFLSFPSSDNLSLSLSSPMRRGYRQRGYRVRSSESQQLIDIARLIRSRAVDRDEERQR